MVRSAITPRIIIESTDAYKENFSTLPKALTALYAVVHKLHSLWRRFRKVKLYTNPHSLIKLGAGHFVYHVGGANSSWLGFTAQSVLLAHRISFCVRSLLHFIEAWKIFKESFKHKEDFNYRLPDRLNIAPFNFSATTEFYLMAKIDRLSLRISTVWRAFYHLMSSLFFLSMRTLDAIEAFHITPESREEAIKELFIHGGELFALIKNEEASCDFRMQIKAILITHQEIVDTVLEKLSYKAKEDRRPAEDLLWDLEECMEKMRVPLSFVNRLKNAVLYQDEIEEKKQGTVSIEIMPSAEYALRDLYDG
jgi:hypothetical protein